MLKPHRTRWVSSSCLLGVGACGDGPGAPPADRGSVDLAALEQRIDAAAALNAPPFPAIADVPFHYANPVSGRPPARSSF